MGSHELLKLKSRRTDPKRRLPSFHRYGVTLNQGLSSGPGELPGPSRRLSAQFGPACVGDTGKSAQLAPLPQAEGTALTAHDDHQSRHVQVSPSHVFGSGVTWA